MQADDQSDRHLDQLQAQTAKVIDYFINSVVVGLIPSVILIIRYVTIHGWGGPVVVGLTCFGGIGLLALRKDGLRPRTRAYLISLLLLVLALSEIYRYGLITAVLPVLTILPILSTIMGGLRVGFMATGISIASLTAIAWYTIANEITPPFLFPDALYSVEEWGRHILVLAISTCVAVFLTGSLFRFHRISAEELRGRNAQLMKAQAQVMQSVKLVGLGYAVVDPKRGVILECDDNFAKMHGLTVAEFMSLDVKTGLIGKIIHEDDRQRAIKTMQHLSRGKVVTAEFRHRLPKGKFKSIRKIFSPKKSDRPNGCLYEVVCQDVTEARDLQEQLFQAQKMKAIGTLTGGVAHDFNNLLAVIMGNLELLDDEATTADQKALIRNGIEATLRGAELTRNMLSFARKSQLEPSIIELNQLVRNVQNWAGRTLPSSISVETALLADLWQIEADLSSTENGLLNLILNARDAMPDGGKLTIETSNIWVDDDYIELRDEEIVQGRYVLLAVSDTGEGIAPENLKAIFEPFFTTKPVGSGTGLGLSMLEGFMRQSGGAVRVYSELGVGTSFKLYFPATEHSQAVRLPPPAPIPHQSAENRATILLVEDNAEVLEAFRATLVKSGFHVLDAPSGDAAYKVFVENPSIDLLLTDIVMPGKLQGTMLATALRELRPDLKVIFMSGYAREATVHGNGLRAQDIRLMKPVRREDLMRAVDKALSMSG